MTAEEAIQHLQTSCLRDHEGRYFFSCKEAFVSVKLRGIDEPLHFQARDKFVFRIGADFLQVERSDAPAVHRAFPWEEIESLAAGEPEASASGLFQG